MSEPIAVRVASEWLASYKGGDDFFVVRIECKKGKLLVVVERDGGITLGECARLNLGLQIALEASILDETVEVSSPGLTEPETHPRVLARRIGQKVEVVGASTEKMRGKLLAVDEEQLTLERQVKERVEGQKRAEIVTRREVVPMRELKYCKILLGKEFTHE